MALFITWHIFVPLFFWLLYFTSSLNAGGATKSRQEVITAYHGAGATDDGRCSRIRRNVLREGGHAVDASVAAALCLGVVSAASSGIGGGSFMLVRSDNGMAQAFDMRETAPMLASQNMYAGNAALKASGALSIAVPGESSHGRDLLGRLKILHAKGSKYLLISTCKWLQHKRGTWRTVGFVPCTLRKVASCSQGISATTKN